MAGIKAEISLKDGVTPILNKINKKLDDVQSATKHLEKAFISFEGRIKKTSSVQRNFADEQDRLIQKGIKGIFRQTEAFNNKTLQMRIAADRRVQSFLKGVERENKAHDAAVQKRLGNALKESLQMIALRYKTQAFVENVNNAELQKNEKRCQKEAEAEKRKTANIMAEIQKVASAYKKHHDYVLKLKQDELAAILRNSISAQNDAVKREAWIQNTLQKGGVARERARQKDLELEGKRLQGVARNVIEEYKLRQNVAQFVEEVNRKALARGEKLQEQSLQKRLQGILKNSLETIKLRQKAEQFVQDTNTKSLALNEKRVQKEIADTGKLLGKKLKASITAIQAKNREAANFENKTLSMRIAADKLVNSYINGIKRRQAASDKATQKEIANQNKIASNGSMLWSKVKTAAGMYFGAQSALGVINTSDSLTMAKARMDVVGDGTHSTEELMNMIYGSAMRSRSGYLDMAASVSKVAMQAGSLFRSGGKQNNAAIVQFMENYNKMAAISGATQQQTSAAMLQIVQALSSGELRGDELRSVLENMPVVADYIAKKMGVARDQILSLGHDGKITAETLRDSVLGATEDLNEKMKKMPYTWGQVWTIFKNAALKAFEPVLNGISAILKNEKFLEFANAMGRALVVAGRVAVPVFNALGSVIGWVYDKVKGIYNFISSNFGWIAPLILGIAAALGVMYIAINAVAWATAIAKTATKAWTAVQTAFNAVMAMNPVAWVIIAIIALIAVIYIVIAVINKCCETSISATGVIAGAFAWLGTAIYDVIIFALKLVITVAQEMVNKVVDAAEWIYNAFNGGFTGWIGGVQNALWTFVNWALQLIKPLIEVWDKIKGTNYSSSLQSTVDAKLNATKSKNYKEFGRIDLASKLEYANPNEWYKKGYNAGKSLDNKVSNLFDYSELTKGLDGDKVNDFYKALTGGFDNPATSGATGNPVLDKISGDTGDIAKNTGKSEEDFSYLRELAEREAINKYTLTDLKIDMTNNNNISNGVDSDNLMQRLAKQLSEAVLSTAEGITPW